MTSTIIFFIIVLILFIVNLILRYFIKKTTNKISCILTIILYINKAIIISIILYQLLI